MHQSAKTFILIFILGLLSSAVPFGYLGILFGSPAVIVNTILISFVFKKELYGVNK